MKKDLDSNSRSERIAHRTSRQHKAPAPPLFSTISRLTRRGHPGCDRRHATGIENLTGLLERDAMDLRISQTLPLEGCAKAHEIIAAGQRAGSVILTM